jgi:hypothetical protein
LRSRHITPIESALDTFGHFPAVTCALVCVVKRRYEAVASRRIVVKAVIATLLCTTASAVRCRGKKRSRPLTLHEGLLALRDALPYLFCTCPKLGIVVLGQEDTGLEIWEAEPGTTYRRVSVSSETGRSTPAEQEARGEIPKDRDFLWTTKRDAAAVLVVLRLDKDAYDIQTSPVPFLRVLRWLHSRFLLSSVEPSLGRSNSRLMRNDAKIFSD